MEARRWQHRFCVQCNRIIPRERLAILPDACLCVKCVTVTPRSERDIEVDGPDLQDLIHAARQHNGER